MRETYRQAPVPTRPPSVVALYEHGLLMSIRVGGEAQVLSCTMTLMGLIWVTVLSSWRIGLAKKWRYWPEKQLTWKHYRVPTCDPCVIDRYRIAIAGSVECIRNLLFCLAIVSKLKRYLSPDLLLTGAVYGGQCAHCAIRLHLILRRPTVPRSSVRKYPIWASCCSTIQAWLDQKITR